VWLRAHSKIPDTFATAEVFGGELVLGQEYKVEAGSQIAIFSWHGCTVELRGQTAQEYDATNATMREYVNAAAVIEAKRNKAEDKDTKAPRVLVLGSDGSGKSTFASFLMNYALRKARTPIYVELDPRGAGSCRSLPSLPGAVCALVADHSAYEFGKEPIAPHKMHKIAPGTTIDANFLSHPQGKSVWMFYGYFDWKDNLELYRKAISQLACLVDGKIQVSAEQVVGRKTPARSGVIVHGPQSPSVELVKEIVELYEIDTVFVLDNEPLVTALKKEYDLKNEVVAENTIDALLRGQILSEELDALNASADSRKKNKVDLCSLARCGGVIPVTQKRLHSLRNQKIKDYFCGVDRDLNPHSFAVNLRDLQVLSFAINDAGATSESWIDRYTVVPYTESPLALKNSLLAVVVAPSIADVALSAMAGLLWVRDVLETEEGVVLHLLSPAPAPLVSPFLVLGDLRAFKYFEL
jgi:polyribonucleotide 5'-hydroxyl-kinase